MDLHLSDKHILITGGSKGMGLAWGARCAKLAEKVQPPQHCLPPRYPTLNKPMHPTPHPMNTPARRAGRPKMAAGLLVLALSAFVAIGPVQAKPAPLQTVPSVDVPRYMGTWHEIAKYPNWFQKKCVSSTQATYTLQADGRVQVLNRCKTDKGEWSEALGAARQIGGLNSPRLKVRFAPEWLSFIPMVWGDYWIIDLDPDYQWVVVSEPDREYLWILSRTPQMPAATYQDLLGKLHDRGFDLKRIEPSRP